MEFALYRIELSYLQSDSFPLKKKFYPRMFFYRLQSKLDNTKNLIAKKTTINLKISVFTYSQ